MLHLTQATILTWMFTFFLGQQVIGGFRGPAMRDRHMQHEPMIGLIMKGAGAYMMTYVLFGVEAPLSIPDPLRLMGVPLVVAGLVLSGWSQWVLGTNWANGVGHINGHELVTSGPYSRIRHPLYSGVALSMAGISLLSADKAVIIGAFFFAASFSPRMFREEKLMQQLFGKQYGEYMKLTGRILPKRGPGASDLSRPASKPEPTAKIHAIQPTGQPRPKPPTVSRSGVPLMSRTNGQPNRSKLPKKHRS